MGEIWARAYEPTRRYRGDVGEIQARYRRDIGEIWARYGQDMGEGVRADEEI